MIFFRQLGALATLLVRYWRRGPLPMSASEGASKRASAAPLRALFVALFVHVGYSSGARCRTFDEARAEATGWLLFGLFGFAVSCGFLSRSPSLRGIGEPLTNPLLDALPLHEAGRVLVAIAQNLQLYALVVSAVVGAAPELGSAKAVAVGLSLSISGLLVGEAVLRLSRVALGSLAVARAASLLVLVQIPFLFATAGASLVASWPPAGPLSARLGAVADAGLLRASLAAPLFALGVVALCGVAGIVLGERLGYDRSYPVPPQRFGRAKPSHLTVDRVEQVLAAREPGAWQSWISFGYALLLGGGLVYLGHAAPEGIEPHLPLAIRVLALVTTLMASSTAFVRAARLAARDLAARPLLLALPISPAELLRGKADGIRLRTLVVASPFFLAALLPVTQAVALDILWRGAGAMIALWLCAGAAVSIGFLTRGVGASQPGVTTFHIENLLLTVPLFGVVAAPSVWGAAVSLGCLALLTLEARRAAMSRVRWIDDSETFDRETPVWRALLAFGAFQATQGLALQAVSGSSATAPVQLAIGYGLAALILTLLTMHGRKDMPPVRWLPERRAALALALAAGRATGDGSRRS
jgi:hypothetical protein